MKLAWALGCAMIIDCGISAATCPAVQQSRTQAEFVAQSDTLESSPLLLRVSFDGGLVPEKKNITGGHSGHAEFVVTRKGRYSFSGDVRPKRKGVLPKSELDDLVRQINKADFVALKSKKFTGECPTVYDGSEVTYTFYTQNGIEVLASCKVAIDDKSPLFVTVSEILEKYRK